MRKHVIIGTMAAALAAVALIVPTTLAAKDRRLTTEDRIEVTRGMMAEYATAKMMLPRSKKPLTFATTGERDEQQWEEAAREHGPAARVGDLVQITKLKIEGDKIVFEINGGMKGGRKWYERVEVGMGTRTTPIGNRSPTAPSGTEIALLFEKSVPSIDSAEIKKLLSPILDFEKRTATEQYVENLPEPIQAAIKEKRAVEGMDKEQVVIALGKPNHKIRETKDGMELEDWVYGTPPGKITFVTFNGSKVIKVKEAYAGLGGSVAPPLAPQ